MLMKYKSKISHLTNTAATIHWTLSFTFQKQTEGDQENGKALNLETKDIF